MSKTVKSTDAIPYYEKLTLNKLKLNQGELIHPAERDLPIVQLGKLTAPFGVSDGSLKDNKATGASIKYSITVQFDDKLNKDELDFFDSVDKHCRDILTGPDMRKFLSVVGFKNPENVDFSSAKRQVDDNTGMEKVDKNGVVYPKKLKLKLSFSKDKSAKEAREPDVDKPLFTLLKGNSSEKMNVRDFMVSGLERRFEIVPLVKFEGIYIISGKNLHPVWKLHGAKVFLTDSTSIPVTLDTFIQDEVAEEVQGEQEVKEEVEEHEEVEEQEEEVVEEEEEEEDVPPEPVKAPTPPPPAPKKVTKKSVKA